MKRIAVLLAGTGYLDGSEIYETTITLLELDRQQVQYQCFAPDDLQSDVVHHINGEACGESRSILAESARLARGAVLPVRQAYADNFDGLIIPGGFGVAKHLCNFATQGKHMTVHPDVLRLARNLHARGKPIGLICIAGALAPAIAGPGTLCTIGTDAELAAEIAEMGGQHVPCEVTDCVVDIERKIASTPAYMLASRISEIEAGIGRLVSAVLAMA
jgi:enhancing lycopene biosynthesis protein 2